MQKNNKKTNTSLRSRAYQYLARREHTRQELRDKLLPYSEEEISVLDTLLDELIEQGYLSDERTAEQITQQARTRFGSQRIAHTLRQKGVEESLIQHNLMQLRDDEFERCKSIWQKKFHTHAENAKETAKQVRFLQSRGFSLEIILKIVRSCHTDAD